jgi:hypothetical protein
MAPVDLVDDYRGAVKAFESLMSLIVTTFLSAESISAERAWIRPRLSTGTQCPFTAR